VAQSWIDLIYETKDGYISVAVMRHKEWCGLAAAAERTEWTADPRFQNSEGIDTHKHARLDLTQSVLRERTTAEWIERLETHGVPCAPVLTRREAIRHPQIEANGILLECDHPQAGRLRQARNPAQFFATPSELRFSAPGLGEHSREILTEAGFSAEEIDDMIESGAVTAAKAEEHAA